MTLHEHIGSPVRILTLTTLPLPNLFTHRMNTASHAVVEVIPDGMTDTDVVAARVARSAVEDCDVVSSRGAGDRGERGVGGRPTGGWGYGPRRTRSGAPRLTRWSGAMSAAVRRRGCGEITTLGARCQHVTPTRTNLGSTNGAKSIAFRHANAQSRSHPCDDFERADLGAMQRLTAHAWVLTTCNSRTRHAAFFFSEQKSRS